MTSKLRNFPSYILLLFIVPVAICLYLYAANFRAAGLFHDDGIYMVNGKSLYQGTGYNIISLPDSPPQTKYPPVLALILSLCWHINPSFPANIMLMRSVSVLCAVLVLFLAWLYVRLKSSCTALVSFFFLSALAFNTCFALDSGQISSDMPFTLFSLASIVLFLHYERCGRKSSLFGSLLVATIAFYARTIGIALFLSFLLWFLYQRRFKVFLGLLAIMIFGIIPWFYWVHTNVPATNSLVTAYYSSYLSWVLLVVQSCSSSSISALFPDLLGLKFPGLVCPFIQLHSIALVTILSSIFAIFFWLFFLKGILYQLRKSPSIDTFYMLIAVAVVVVWSSLGYNATRFLVPLLPIVLFHLMEGIKAAKEDATTLSFIGRNLARPLWWLGVTVLLVGIYVVAIPRTAGTLRKSCLNSETLFLCMEDACDWIGNNTERGDVIASHLDPLVYLLSGRRAVNVACINPLAVMANSVNAYDEDDILVAIKKYGVRYLLMLHIHRWSFEDGLRNKKLSEIINKYPDAFHKCHEKDGAFAIYRVEREYLGEKHKGISSVNRIFAHKADKSNNLGYVETYGPDAFCATAIMD